MQYICGKIMRLKEIVNLGRGSRRKMMDSRGKPDYVADYEIKWRDDGAVKLLQQIYLSDFRHALP